jgi:Flp pilus assembly protein TadG
MIRFRRPQMFLKDTQAAVTIEFVVTLPMFLAALAFAFEFGQIFLAHQSTVNNVRSAARYLARSDQSATDLVRVENIIRTGLPVGGTAPDYLNSTNATVGIDTAHKSFGPPNFSRSGTATRIRTQVNYPLSIFGFTGNGSLVSIPFVVVEDFRFVGV